MDPRQQYPQTHARTQIIEHHSLARAHTTQTHTVNPQSRWYYGIHVRTCATDYVTPYLSLAYFRVLDHLGSVSVSACPIVGFVARLQIPLPHTRAVGPRVRGLYTLVWHRICAFRGFVRATFRPHLNEIHPAYAPQES